MLPNSVLSNATFESARKELGKIGYLTHVVFLPSETFQTTGTQTTTAILIARAYGAGETPQEKVAIRCAEVTNVGFDATGRILAGNQLPGLPGFLRLVEAKGENPWRTLPPVPKDQSFSQFKTANQAAGPEGEHVLLKDVAVHIGTGQTPARSAYTAEGLFVIKVGNLTGAGISFAPRERNFIDAGELTRRCGAGRPLLVEPDDLLLTSSAHSPAYIAEKVDIVGGVPQQVGGRATFVGEIMLVRVDPGKIDPYALLAFLRTEEAKAEIRRMVRGQTAHLHPGDLGELPIPRSYLKQDTRLNKAKQLLRRQVSVAAALNDLEFELAKLIP